MTKYLAPFVAFLPLAGCTPAPRNFGALTDAGPRAAASDAAVASVRESGAGTQAAAPIASTPGNATSSNASSAPIPPGGDDTGVPSAPDAGNAEPSDSSATPSDSSIVPGTTSTSTQSAPSAEHDSGCSSCDAEDASSAECLQDGCPCPGAEGHLCNATCVNTQTDLGHCGSCGTTCTTGACVQGDCKSWGAPVKVGDGLTSSQLSVVIDSAGNAFVAYMGTTEEGLLGVYARRRAAAEGSWEAAQLLDGVTTRGASNTKPQVGLDDVGNALVSWGSQDGFGYSRYRSSTWSAAAFVTTAPYTAPPVLHVSPAGDAFAAWDDQEGRAGTEVWFRRYSGSANAWYAAEQLDQTTDQTACLGAIASDPSGNALVVYSEAAQVYARWWSATTQAWVATGQLLNDGYCFVSTAFDGDGTSVVVSAGSDNIYGSIATSQSAWTTTALAPPGESSSYRGHVTAFAGRGGDAVVAIENWADYRSTLALSWSAVTQSWQGITPLMTGSASGDFIGVDLSLDAAGNGFVVSGSSATGEVVGRRRSGADGSFAPIETLGPRQTSSDAEPLGIDVFEPRIRVAASGNAILVWMEADADGAITVWSRYYE